MKTIIFLILTIPFYGFAQTGRLFTTQLSLEGSLTKMVITTNIPHHQYQTAGITLPSGYTFAHDSCPSENGHTCTFQVSDTNPVTLYVEGENQRFTSTLCLNQQYQLNCERITTQFTTHVLEMGAYASGANGQIYSGYNNSNWSLYSPAGFENNQFKGSYCANDGSYCIAAGFFGTSNSNFIPAAFTQVNQNGAWISSDTSSTTSGLSSPIQFWSVSCVPDSQYCVAAGNGAVGGGQLAYAWYSYDAGTTWSSPNIVPAPTGGFYASYQAFGTSCYSSTTHGQNCVIAANSSDNYYGIVARGPVIPNQPITLTSTYIQSTSSIAPNFVDTTDIYCSHQGHCILSANLSNSIDLSSSLNPEFSAIYYSNDGGGTWSPSQITTLAPPDGVVSNVSGVSCDASGTHCVASGWYSTSLNNSPAQGLVYVSDDGGVTWPKTIVFPYPSSQSNVNRFNAIRCSQTNSICYVTGHGGNSNDGTEFPVSYISYDNGKTWSNVSFLPLPASQQSSPSSNLFTLALFNTIQ